MSKSDPPTPPNPTALAGAATSTNIGTGIANSYLNNMNQITREGELRFDQTGNFDWNDPETGKTYKIPRFTATQILSGDQEAVAQQTDQAKYNLANMANTQSERVKNLLGNEMDFSGAPGAGDPNLIGGMSDPRSKMGFNAQRYLDANPDVFRLAAQEGIDPNAFAEYHYQQVGAGEGRQTGYAGQQTGTLADTGQQQREFGDAGDITRSYSPDDNWSADRSRVEQSLFDRLNPQLDRERANLEQRLSDQGIRYGSTAYTQAMDDYSRQSNDARLAVTAAGGQEQTRMTDMAAKAAGFQNAAQQQAYTQAQGRGQFFNAAQQADYAQALSSGQFKNAAQKDAVRAGYGADQSLQHLARAAAQPASEHVQRAERLAPAVHAGAVRAAQSADQRDHRADERLAGAGPELRQHAEQNQIPTHRHRRADQQSLQPGHGHLQAAERELQLADGRHLRSAASGGMVQSDRREKEDIDEVGTVFAAGPDGEKPLPIYEYSYKDDPANARQSVRWRRTSRRSTSARCRRARA